MLRKIFLLLVVFLHPIIIPAQEKLIKKEDEENLGASSDSTFENQISVGIHWLFIARELWGDFSKTPIIIQTSYKRDLGKFSLRSGLDFGYQKYNYINSSSIDKIQFITLINIGVEEEFFEIKEKIHMMFGGELAYTTVYPNINHSSEHRTFGLNLVWANELSFNKRSSLFLEFGLFYGRYWRGKILKNREINTIGKWQINEPRNFILSYAYKF